MITDGSPPERAAPTHLPTPPRLPRARRAHAALCRERVALIRAAADRRFALAATHTAYFRSLAAVGDALRRVAAAAPGPSLLLQPVSQPAIHFYRPSSASSP
ncbi:hypothetical protein U9M48_040165 [Paspalum notatum var. saurae]|uniref:DUF630 domain-containing protein n=1 Tax=Paspalum notatum var. saurae TaxID=547442 RepID=A0AAQ3XDF5_PASNO